MTAPSAPRQRVDLRLLFLALLAVAPAAASGQEKEGSGPATVAGGALGAYSGAALGLSGALLPCDRTLTARRCVILTTVGSGAFGSTMGALIGSKDEGALARRAEKGGYGVLVGAAVGIVLRRAVRQYEWGDALAVAALGGAIGAAGRGALIGAAAGVAVGALTWLLIPDTGLPDLVMVTLGGIAVGGLYDWADGAASAGDSPVIPVASFSIPLG